MKENTKEIISYVFVGIMTTLVNYIVYFVLLMIHCHWLVANSISWFFAVIFAYYANKKYVFESYDEKSGSVKQQVYRIHSYGENQIVLQKEEPDNQEIFLIKVKDDYLAVYKKADRQLFETTNIPIEALPSDEQVQVLAGKEVTGTEALYSFLENYSS